MNTQIRQRLMVAALGTIALVPSSRAAAQTTVDYRVLATNKTSTMQKEMQQASDAGFRFARAHRPGSR